MAELVGHVAELWQYPVKSMAGVRLPAAELRRDGLLGDRGWCAREEDAGQLTVVRRTPRLLQCQAVYESEASEEVVPPVRITLPDGQSFSSSEPDAAAKLSAFIGKPLTLWPRQPRSKLRHYSLARPQGAREFRRQFASRSLPDLSSIPMSKILELMFFVTPLGRYHDVYPMHVLSSSSLEHLQTLEPEADFSVQRVRPNVFIESCPGTSGLDDFSWVGGELQLGTTVLSCRSRTVRCSAPAQPMGAGMDHGASPEGGVTALGKSAAVLKTLEAETGRHLGINANVRTPGAVALGDPVYWVAPRKPARQRLSAYQRLRNRLLHASLEAVDRFLG